MVQTPELCIPPIDVPLIVFYPDVDLWRKRKEKENSSLLKLSFHLGCFHVLAIVNSATKNTGGHVSFRNCGFLTVYASSGVAGHMVGLFLVF